LQGYVRAMLSRGDDSARTQVLADLWATAANEAAVRQRFSDAIRHRRLLLRAWIEEAAKAGELREIPANALASILLALGDGLMLHAGLYPSAFQWRNVGRALTVMLEGLAPGGGADA
jgi:hypothetical protein